MENYSLISILGSGSYGTVYKAVDLTTNEVVAVKRLKQKYHSMKECLQLVEVKSLRKLNGHPNIVKLKELIYENNEAFFVFEYMDTNLFDLIKNKQERFSEAEVRKLMLQILLALEYMHRLEFFHRDLKPENLLVSKDVIKVADLGMARRMMRCVPCYTSGVTTLEYRAPEVLLQFSDYGAPIDMWAVGAIMAALITSRTLFPGRSEIEQLHVMQNEIGAPTKITWPDGLKAAARFSFKFPRDDLAPNLGYTLRYASPAARNLITALCSWNPYKRPTALQALQHPFFQVHNHIVPSPFSRRQGCQYATGVKGGKEGTYSTVMKKLQEQARLNYLRNCGAQHGQVLVV